ncbi:MAG: DMT family transporter, partial [Bacteroidales bacterium]|nr:DMT family transporter [Bacteroidales bacterium]
MKNQRHPAVVYAIALAAMLFWGLSFVWTAIALKYYEPFTILFIRLIFSSGLLFLFLWLSGRFQKIKASDYKLFLLSSFLNPFLYFIGETFGIKYTSSTISAVIIATIPVFTPIAAIYALKERLSVLSFAGLIVSFFGILIMLVEKNLNLAASPLGIFLLLFAVASAIGYSVFLKRLTQKYSAITIIAVQNLLGAAYFLPFFLVFGLSSFLRVSITPELAGSMAALIIFASSMAFILYTVSTREIGISRTNVFSNTI